MGFSSGKGPGLGWAGKLVTLWPTLQVVGMARTPYRVGVIAVSGSASSL